MKILITGGSGFLASHVLSECSSRSYDVVLQTRRPNLIGLSPHPCANIEYFSKSFLELLPSDLEAVDAVIHLASAGVSPRASSWSDLFEINVNGTLHMCRLAQQTSTRIVLAGSSVEYGKSAMRYLEIPVDAPMEPTSPYACSKAAACQISLGFARSEEIELAYLRIFNAYGKGQHHSNLWPSLVKAALDGTDYQLSPGEQIRDFVEASQVAAQLVDAATISQLRPGSPLVANVASGTPQTVRTFCEAIWARFSTGGRLLVGSLPYRDNEVMRYIPSMKSLFL